MIGDQPLRIVVFAQFAGSPMHGMVLGHYFLAREWVALGHQVTIIAASFAHTRHTQPACGTGGGREDISGIDYVWLPTPAYSPSSSVGRLRSIASYSMAAYRLAAAFTSADIVVSSSHHPFAFLAAERLARRSGARLVFEVRDLWPLTLIELGGISRLNPVISAMQWAEDRAYRQSDVVVSVLSHARDYMVGRGMAPQKFVYIPNGIDPSLVAEALPESHVSQLNRFSKKGDLLVGYAGRVGVANALIPLIQALAYPGTDSARLAVLGAGPAVPDILRTATELGVSDRVLVLPAVSRPQVEGFLGRIDVGYLGLQPSPLFRFGISPTKLNDYLLAGLPVLLAVDAPCEATDEVAAGWKVPPDRPDAIAHTLATISAMSPHARSEVGTAGRDWVIRTRGYPTLARRFLDAATSRC